MYPASSSREASFLFAARQGELAFVDDLASLHDENNGLGVVDIRRRILAQQHKIGELALIHRAKLVRLAEKPRAVMSRDSQGIERRNACCNQQLQFALRGRPAALVRAAGHDSAV